MPPEDLTALYPVGNLYRARIELNFYSKVSNGWSYLGNIPKGAIFMIAQWHVRPEAILVIHGDLIGFFLDGFQTLTRETMELWFEPISLVDNTNSSIGK